MIVLQQHGLYKAFEVGGVRHWAVTVQWGVIDLYEFLLLFVIFPTFSCFFLVQRRGKGSPVLSLGTNIISSLGPWEVDKEPSSVADANIIGYIKYS